jgi:hypothetical protein
MVVAVIALERLDRHAQKACDLPQVYAALHEPGRGGVAKGVRCHVAVRLGEANTDTPEQLDDDIRTEIGKWSEVVRISGAKAE